MADLTLVVRADGERQVPDGGPSVSGFIWIGDRVPNLNKPGAVRASIDAGWMTKARTVGRRNGWDLFDAVYASSATSSSTL
ncbi:hypothetical protein ACLMAJ_12995 [Nocardia sp. KC 131]|uniref:hypothetical protein n=1 Tax=Nocardia arseniciresistens TaxID=3392119 RepID=UPI00398E3691